MSKLIDILRSICESIEQSEPEPEPIVVDAKEVDQDFVEDALEGLEQWDEIEKWYPMDGTYWVPSKETFWEIVERDGTNEKEYVSDRYDCEDFTITMESVFRNEYGLNNIGTVLTYAGSPHAFNIVVFKDGTAMLFEPQSDDKVTKDEQRNDEMYDLNGSIVHV